METLLLPGNRNGLKSIVTLYCAAAAFGCYLLHITAFILLFVGFWLGQLVAEWHGFVPYLSRGRCWLTCWIGVVSKKLLPAAALTERVPHYRDRAGGLEGRDKRDTEATQT